MAGTGPFLKGQLLLDSGLLRGSFFQRTVVLICQHDAEGAFGLVLNRATGGNVGEMVVADLPEKIKNCPLYLGGPVQPSALSFIYTDFDGLEEEEETQEAPVLPDLTLGHSLDTLMNLGEAAAPNRRIRLFAGYSGWSAGQLEDEMKNQAWIPFPASQELVFEHKPDQLWHDILMSMGWRYQLLAQMPEDPSSN